MAKIESGFQVPEDRKFRIVADQKKSEVDHPDHYNWLPGTECIDVAEHFNFNLGNAVKYIWRVETKEISGALVDLRKARWYVDREIKRMEAAIARLTPIEEEILAYEKRLKEEEIELDERTATLVPTEEQAVSLARKMLVELDDLSFTPMLDDRKEWTEWVRVVVAALDIHEAATFVAEKIRSGGGEPKPDMARCRRKAEIIRILWREMKHDTATTTA